MLRSKSPQNRQSESLSMANLKGSDHGRQIYDAMYRLEARGESRTGEAREDGLNHSHATAEKREMALNDFAKFAEENELVGKLNELMTPENISSFLQERTEGLKASTTEGYISNFSALVKGLESKNISIPVAQDRERFFESMKDQLGRADSKNFETGRYIERDRAEQIIEKINERSSAIAELQYRHGFRASEARAIVNNSEKYLEGNRISGVAGKGGQRYAEKVISNELRDKIERAEGQVSRDQYYRDIEKVIENNRAHDLRLSYAVNHYQELRENGASHSESLRETSEELNHHRESMTEYYQSRG